MEGHEIKPLSGAHCLKNTATVLMMNRTKEKQM
jgi:hypothetical protein